MRLIKTFLAAGLVSAALIAPAQAAPVLYGVTNTEGTGGGMGTATILERI